ncbi:SprT family zinc-dependent metalloprotease [Globicatella sulfidifaciens]|uniref:M48 family metallopeptidase n=1 Tax=Globicatella sulfidifaciens TaxID=136093 RepID=A0A7X8C5V9_9LACT|nr:SprT family zinc-dependent metalloprotease [Globicatella sulfidifaciens]NLJ19447.1 M48 family metallopeptidase [Globicatella sulfidifaciens]
MGYISVSGIEIEVIKKNIKNIHLSVHPPNGRVRLATPDDTDDDAIRLFVISKLDWIRKQQRELQEQERISARQYLSGESHYYLGERYLLNVLYTKGRQTVEIAGKKEMNLFVRENNTIEQRERVMNEWYREQLKSLIPSYIDKWEKKMDVQVKDWGVRRMRTKWGSCNIQDKRIWLNLELAKKPPHCLEYVVVHEMVHLLERNHNERFRAYMDQFLPNWKAIKTELNGTLFESNG